MQSVVNGVTTAFVGQYFEWTGSTSTMKKYYYFGAQRVAVRDGNGTGTTGLSWLLTDHLGSTTVTLDAAGAKNAEKRYKPWGEERFTFGTLPTQYTYTGQYSHTAQFGLLFYNARWYDPLLSRFAQADSIIPNPYYPSDFDRYNYVRSNPVRYNDPSGHCLGPLAEVCAHIMLQLMVDLIATDLGDGSFDTPSHVRTAVDTTRTVFTNNPLQNYRDQKLIQTLNSLSSEKSPNITNWLVSTMNNNASGSIARQLRGLNAGNVADRATALIVWTALVKGGGPWDFKVDFNNKDISNVTLGGVSLNMDVVANIHYGFVGASSGFDLEILLMGAGGAQIMDKRSNWGWWSTFFDQPEDVNAIILGYQLYEQYGAELTVEQFITAIVQNQYLLNQSYPQPD